MNESEVKPYRLKRGNRKPMMLWLTPDEHDLIFAAAKSEHRRATEFVTHYSLKAAMRIRQGDTP